MASISISLPDDLQFELLTRVNDGEADGNKSEIIQNALREAWDVPEE